VRFNGVECGGWSGRSRSGDEAPVAVYRSGAGSWCDAAQPWPRRRFTCNADTIGGAGPASASNRAREGVSRETVASSDRRLPGELVRAVATLRSPQRALSPRAHFRHRPSHRVMGNHGEPRRRVAASLQGRCALSAVRQLKHPLSAQCLGAIATATSPHRSRPFRRGAPGTQRAYETSGDGRIRGNGRGFEVPDSQHASATASRAERDPRAPRRVVLLEPSAVELL